MKERPILFSGPMVRAILEGRKAQTRRVVKPVPGTDGFVMQLDVCPYGVPGDRLWVRETWSKWDNGSRQVVYAADRETREVHFEHGDPVGVEPERFNLLTERARVTWRPSIHMPRWASRITLEIEEVRVQRVQEISESDIEAEGAPFAYAQEGGAPRGGLAAIRAEKIGRSFLYGIWAERWDRINAKRGFGWDQNPWVWAITFKRVSGETSNVPAIAAMSGSVTP